MRRGHSKACCGSLSVHTCLFLFVSFLISGKNADSTAFPYRRLQEITVKLPCLCTIDEPGCVWSALTRVSGETNCVPVPLTKPLSFGLALGGHSPLCVVCQAPVSPWLSLLSSVGPFHISSVRPYPSSSLSLCCSLTRQALVGRLPSPLVTWQAHARPCRPFTQPLGSAYCYPSGPCRLRQALVHLDKPLST